MATGAEGCASLGTVAPRQRAAIEPQRAPGRVQGDGDPRPLLAPALDRLIGGIARGVPALSHVDWRRLLVVAGQARGIARASIRPLQGERCAAEVVIDGRRRLYEITLRPLWFRTATAERRLEALVHELWHLGSQTDGRLSASHRHRHDRASAQRAEIREMTRAALDALDPLLLAPLGHDGEVLVRAWLVRPLLTGEEPPKKKYTNKDMYLQPMRLITPSAVRSVWW